MVTRFVSVLLIAATLVGTTVLVSAPHQTHAGKAVGQQVRPAAPDLGQWREVRPERDGA
jgi:hypothetical protein